MQKMSVGGSIKSLAPNLTHFRSEKFSTFAVTWLASVQFWQLSEKQLYAASPLQELTSVIIVPPSSSESKSSTAEMCASYQQFSSVKNQR